MAQLWRSWHSNHDDRENMSSLILPWPSCVVMGSVPFSSTSAVHIVKKEKQKVTVRDGLNGQQFVDLLFIPLKELESKILWFFKYFFKYLWLKMYPYKLLCVTFVRFSQSFDSKFNIIGF